MSVNVTTGPATLSWPHLTELEVRNGNSKPKVSTAVLVPKSDTATIEALTGSVNLRGRSMLILRSVFTRAPLPPALARMRLTVRGAYFLYGLACALLSVVGTVFGVAWLGMIVVGIVRGVLA